MAAARLGVVHVVATDAVVQPRLVLLEHLHPLVLGVHPPHPPLVLQLLGLLLLSLVHFRQLRWVVLAVVVEALERDLGERDGARVRIVAERARRKGWWVEACYCERSEGAGAFEGG
jgi:hypothetical protein